jgi:hypothetical protein
LAHKVFLKARFLLVSALIFASVGRAQQLTPADAQRYLADVKALTAPEMEGRGDGTKGLTRAEKLIVERYKKLELVPAGTKGYLQPFSVAIGRKLKQGNRLIESQGPGHHRFLKLNEDFVPLSISASGSVRGQLLFSGYGITAPELGYDDYKGLDAKGKIVLVLRKEPEFISEKAAHGGLSRHADLVTKAINAKNHGAIALIAINGNLGKSEDSLLPFGDAEGPEDVGIPCIQVKNSVVATWFGSEDQPQMAQEKIDKSGKPIGENIERPMIGFANGDGLRLDVRVETIRATVNNVMAYLPGKTDEYVIVGAHYDHLGRGGAHSLAPSQTGTIHPGADDNASGTAGVLELARVLSEHRGELKRGVLFMNFAGEELGLLGSAAWVNAPTKPLDKAVAMVNMDMIGRIKDGKVFVGGVGTGTTLKAMLDEAKSGTKFEIEPSESGYSSSDHTSFVTKRIPVLFFFSGLHSDYHKPSDTWDKINTEAAAQLLDLVGRVDVELASTAERPTFVAVAENPHAGGVSSGGGYGPYFGSVPDFGENKDGVKFSDVRPGSPAAKAGLRAGDVLTKFGDKTIHNLYDFTDALRRSGVGDLVEVTVLREGKPMTVSVTLEQRK